MRNPTHIQSKIIEGTHLVQQVSIWRLFSKKIVFTNGCFDILHKGHLALLSEAAEKGDILIIGVNSDASVKRLKGDLRPVNDETFRSQMLASLSIVDAVVIFDEDTPLQLIRTIQPDVLVKGGDYNVNDIVGAEDVIKNGGSVDVIPFLKGYSTTELIERIQSL
jgi:D-glycero-beta-D-manno-heptose 1-phosphate adenylyltransferase